jgi:hypothetical protein
VESAGESREQKDLKEALPIGLTNESFSSFSCAAKSRRSHSQDSKAVPKKKEGKIAALRRLATKDARGGGGGICGKCKQMMNAQGEN